MKKLFVCIIVGKSTNLKNLLSLFKNDLVKIYKPQRKAKDNSVLLLSIKKCLHEYKDKIQDLDCIFIKDSCITHSNRECLEDLLNSARYLDCDILNLARSSSRINGEFTLSDDFIKRKTITPSECLFITKKGCDNILNDKYNNMNILDTTIPFFLFNPLLATHDEDYNKCNIYTLQNRASDRRILTFFIFVIIVIFITIVIIHIDYKRNDFIRLKPLRNTHKNTYKVEDFQHNQPDDENIIVNDEMVKEEEKQVEKDYERK